MKYWDASAIVPLLVRQARTPDLLPLLREDPVMVTWWGSAVECYSAITRLGRQGALDREAAEAAVAVLRGYQDGWREVAPTDDLRRGAERLLRIHDLRAADALQLAAALAACDHDPRNLAFVGLDRRLSAAAGLEGFVLAV